MYIPDLRMACKAVKSGADGSRYLLSVILHSSHPHRYITHRYSGFTQKQSSRTADITDISEQDHTIFMTRHIWKNTEIFTVTVPVVALWLCFIGRCLVFSHYLWLGVRREISLVE